MSEPVTTLPQSRLYFLPDAFDFEAQPTAFKTAYIAFIEPAYQQLVVAQSDALEKSTGMTIVFLLVEELLDQQEMGIDFDLAQKSTRGDREAREKVINRHLKLIGAKQTAINSLLRLRKLSRQRDSE